MLTAKGKARQFMIESSGLPFHRIVTDRTVMVELPRDVIRCYHCSEVIHVTSITISGRRFVAASMTLAALKRNMCSRLHERNTRMHETSLPRKCRHGVTVLARVIEVRQCVVRFSRAFEIITVTGVAIRRCVDEFLFLLIDVAG